MTTHNTKTYKRLHEKLHTNKFVKLEEMDKFQDTYPY